MGLDSLPVVFGVDKAKWICAASIDLTQLAVAAYLALIGETIYAEVLVGLVVPQMVLQVAPPRDACMPLGARRSPSDKLHPPLRGQGLYLLRDPIKYDVKYQASAQPFLVFGILTTALACADAGL